jgi:hypothetical protein
MMMTALSSTSVIVMELALQTAFLTPDRQAANLQVQSCTLRLTDWDAFKSEFMIEVEACLLHQALKKVRL